jgi:hypothetical protein
MSYSVAFLGELVFAGGGEEAWLESSPTSSAFDDWPDALATEEEDAGGTVRDLLDDLAPSMSAIQREGGRVKLRALLDKDDYLDKRAALAAAFRGAAQYGGEGGLVVIGWIDFPGTLAIRVTAHADGTSACDELSEKDTKAVEKGLPYAELEAIVEQAILAAEAPPLLAEAASAALVVGSDAAAPLEEAFAALAGALPTYATFMEQGTVPKLPIVAALASHPSPETTPRALAELRRIAGGPLVGKPSWQKLDHKDLLMTLALTEVLARRGGAEAEQAVHAVWIEHPSWFLRQHERVYKLGRDDLKRRLAALLGTDPRTAKEKMEVSTPSQEYVVAALFDLDPSAVERVGTLLDRPREDPGVEEALRWIPGHLAEKPALRSPAWEAWLARAAAREPWADNVYDLYEQLRVEVLGVMVAWKLPQPSALVTEHFDVIHTGAACELLAKIGDPAALPLLRDKLAKQRRKDARAPFEKAIAALGGAEPAAATPAEPTGNHIAPAPSGRAACRACKEKIAKGELRFGESVPNVFSDSGEPSFRWYHLRCAAEKKAAILGPVLDAYTGEVPERAALHAAILLALAKKKKKK